MDTYALGEHKIRQIVFSPHQKLNGYILDDITVGVYDERRFPQHAMVATVIGPAFENYPPDKVGLSRSGLHKLLDMAYLLGSQLAKKGVIVNTGAPMGVAAVVAHGAKMNGGYTFGISPVKEKRQHQKKWEEAWINQSVLKALNPFSIQNIMLYTGLGFNARNVLNVQVSTQYLRLINGDEIDASMQFGITIAAGSGGDGTFHEGITAKEELHTLGVLQGFGGAAEELKERYGMSGKHPMPILFRELMLQAWLMKFWNTRSVDMTVSLNARRRIIALIC